MAIIDLREFGGILPSVDPRSYGVKAAQRAESLDLRFGDFRPLGLNGTNVFAVTPGVKSIFKTPGAGTWLSSDQDVSYVRGQINDSVERIYLTGRTTYPEVWQGGTYRKLGVPRPNAPVATLTSVYDPYTPVDRAKDIEINLIGGLVSAVRASLTTQSWIGAKTSHGMATWNIASGFAEDNNPQLVFGEAGGSGVLTNSLTKGWLLDPKLDGFWHPGGTYYCVPIHAYGYWYTPVISGGSGLQAKVEAFTVPQGPDAGDPLFTSTQVTDFTTTISTHFSTNSAHMEALRGRLTAVVNAFHKLASTSQDAAMVDAVQDFYAQSAVANEISSALDNLVSSMLDRLEGAYYATPASSGA